MMRKTLSLIWGKITLRDLFMSLLWKSFLREQSIYNFYLKKFKFIDRRNGTQDVSILLLAGKYEFAWETTFKRLYEYQQGIDVIVVNPGGISGELCMKMAEEYGWSYFESKLNNLSSAQNYVIRNLIDSNKIIKIDDDVLVTKNSIKNLLRTYSILKEKNFDVAFIAPVINLNNVSYYYFLKTLELEEKYRQKFEEPLIFKHWTKQKIWYDPEAAIWIWEHSLPLNDTASIFETKNKDMWTPIPVRFSTNMILFEKKFLLDHTPGLMARPPRVYNKKSIEAIKERATILPDFDEASINYYADTLKYARILALDAFAGHLSYNLQREEIKKWYEKNKKRLLEDL